MTIEGTVKIKKEGLKLFEPSKLRITPKYDAVFEIDGTAIVPGEVAKLLLSPAYAGSGYVLVKETVEKAEDPIVEKAEDPIVEKPKAAQSPGRNPVAKVTKTVPKPEQQDEETKAFAKSIVE